MNSQCVRHPERIYMQKVQRGLGGAMASEFSRAVTVTKGLSASRLRHCSCSRFSFLARTPSGERLICLHSSTH